MDSLDSKVILKALAEIRRRQIIATKFNPETEQMYDNSFAHAVMHSIYPIKHEHPGLERNSPEILARFPYYETYDAGFEIVQEIAELLDKKWGETRKRLLSTM